MTWTAYNDAHSRAVIEQFRKALGPTLAQIAPDWLLHHIEIRRDQERGFVHGDERVEIRLIIKPIGQAVVSAKGGGDLATGPLRLGGGR